MKNEKLFVVERKLPTTQFFQNTFVHPNGFFSFDELEARCEDIEGYFFPSKRVVGRRLYDQNNKLVAQNFYHKFVGHGFYILQEKENGECKLFNNEKKLIYTFIKGFVVDGCAIISFNTVSGHGVKITDFRDGWFEIVEPNKPAMLYDPAGKLRTIKTDDVSFQPYANYASGSESALDFKPVGRGRYSLITEDGELRFDAGRWGASPRVTLQDDVYMIGYGTLLTKGLRVIISDVKLFSLGSKRFIVVGKSSKKQMCRIVEYVSGAFYYRRRGMEPPIRREYEKEVTVDEAYIIRLK